MITPTQHQCDRCHQDSQALMRISHRAPNGEGFVGTRDYCLRCINALLRNPPEPAHRPTKCALGDGENAYFYHEKVGKVCGRHYREYAYDSN